MHKTCPSQLHVLSRDFITTFIVGFRASSWMVLPVIASSIVYLLCVQKYFFNLFVLRAFSVTPKTAREWLFSGEIPLIVEVPYIPSSVFYSLSSKKVAVMNSRWFSAASAAAISFRLKRYPGKCSSNVSSCILTMSPKFS